MLEQAIALVILAMAVSAVSITVSLSKIAAPFRAWVKARSPFIGDLVSCPYCFSHWASLLAVILFRPLPVHTGWVVADGLIAAFAMVSAASWFAYIIIHTYGSHGKEKNSVH